MRFSVVLPVYNRASSITSSIESVLGQTRPADEIIIIDDGSTDAIETVLERFGDKVRLIRQPNAGAAAARNTGARAASGDWLVFQDSDDLWLPGHLEYVERDLAEAGPKVVCHLGDIIYTGDGYSIRLFEIKGRTFPSGAAETASDPLSLVISGMSLLCSAIRRDVFVKIGGFDPQMRMLEDTAFFCQLALEGDFLVTGDLLAEGRRLPGDQDSITSLAKKNALYANQMHVRILDRLLPRELTKEQRLLVRRMLSGAEFRLAEVVRRSSPRDARKLLWTSAARHPQPLVGWGKSIIALFLGEAGYRLVLGSNQVLDRS